jgi:hypothetical protein
MRASWISMPAPLKDKTIHVIGAAYVQQVKSTARLANRVSPQWCEMLQAPAQSFVRANA